MLANVIRSNNNSNNNSTGIVTHICTAISKKVHCYIKYKFLVLLFLPAIVSFLIFNYAPMYGIIIAFKDFKFLKGILNSPWTSHNGFGHFYTMFSGRTFPKVFLNTIYISSLKLIFGFPAPIILALLLNELRNIRLKKFIQTITYMNHFIGWVILTGILKQFLSPSIGPIGYIMQELGMQPINFLSDSHWFKAVLVSSSIWKEVGWGSVVYLATIAGINPELYEAAITDGATRLQCAIHITLPSLSFVIAFLFTLGLSSIISDDFDQIFNLMQNNPAVLNSADVISTYTYRQGLKMMEYGYAAAVGLFKNVIAIIMLLVTDLVLKKSTQGEHGIF